MVSTTDEIRRQVTFSTQMVRQVWYPWTLRYQYELGACRRTFVCPCTSNTLVLVVSTRGF